MTTVDITPVIPPATTAWNLPANVVTAASTLAKIPKRTPLAIALRATVAHAEQALGALLAEHQLQACSTPPRARRRRAELRLP